MKIGILTHPLETNYGGTLQAFALQKVLRDMGHDAITIDRHNRAQYPSLYRHILSFFKRVLQHFVFHKNVSARWDPFISEDEYKYVSQNTQQFINNNIRLTRKIYSSELKKIDEEYAFDAYVVGSDQVWLPDYCPNSFLDFVNRPNVVKLFYAASAGARNFANDSVLLSKCRELVKDFKAVSVREQSLVKLSKDFLNVDAQWVLDPTMLLGKEDYTALCKPSICHEKNLFTYILDSSADKDTIISKIAQEKELKIVKGNVEQYYVKSSTINLDACVFPSIESWIEGYHHADFVVTDSFHGTVFCLLFNKPFITVGNPQRGIERFKSLLKMFGLEHRLVTSVDEALAIYRKEVDFSSANSSLEKYRKESIDFLKTNLE